MKKLAMVILTIMFCVSISSGALGQEIKVGTLLAHTGELGEMANGVQNGVILASKQSHCGHEGCQKTSGDGQGCGHCGSYGKRGEHESS